MEALRVFTSLGVASLVALLLCTFRCGSASPGATGSAGIIDAASRIDSLEAEAIEARSQIDALKADLLRETAFKVAAVRALRERIADEHALNEADAAAGAQLECAADGPAPLLETLQARVASLEHETAGLRAESDGLRAEAAAREAASVVLRASLADERNARAAAEAAREISASTAVSAGDRSGDAAERARDVAEARAQLFTLISALGEARERIAALEVVVKNASDENDALRKAAEDARRAEADATQARMDEGSRVGAEALARVDLAPPSNNESSSESGDAREWKTSEASTLGASRVDAEAVKVPLNASARKAVVSPFSNRSSFYAAPAGGVAASSKVSFSSALRI